MIRGRGWNARGIGETGETLDARGKECKVCGIRFARYGDEKGQCRGGSHNSLNVYRTSARNEP